MSARSRGATGEPARVVALESSTRPASLAVRVASETRELVLAEDRPHASDLASELERLLAEAGAAPRELDLVVVGLGPGSYTGLRVGAATALGLSYGSGAALVGVPSFEVLALGALADGERADVLVDARGGHLYHARYTRNGDRIEEERAPSALTPDEARAALAAEIWLADDDALAAAGLAPEPERQRSGRAPRASDLLVLGLERLALHGPTPAGELQPLYLRSFTPRQRSR